MPIKWGCNIIFSIFEKINLVMQSLFERQKRLIENTSLEFKRSLFENIDWSNRLIEIKGARGVGKTTLMLQRVKELQSKGENALYVTMDDPYFFKNTLYELADDFYKYGGIHLFIDEVHRYPPKIKKVDWSVEIKNIYDSFPDLFVVYSGSSILEIYRGEGDLSRRKVSYSLNGLSFREYLEFKEVLKTESSKLDDIVLNHVKLAHEVISNVKILPLFKEYLRTGFYPFFIETKLIEKYYDRLRSVVNLIIENDITAVTDIKYESVAKLKKLLALIATSAPYTSNMKTLASHIYVSDYKSLLKLLNYLEKSELLILLNAGVKGNKILHKPDKIYINNPNLLYVLGDANVSTGTIRETFFINQLRYGHNVKFPASGDFLVDNKYLFEIGGKNKTRKQLADKSDSYVVSDDIEIGFGNKIPLFLFGFLY